MGGGIPKRFVDADGFGDFGAFATVDGDKATVTIAFGDPIADRARVERIGEQVAHDGKPPALPSWGGNVCGVESLGDGCEREPFVEKPVFDLVEAWRLPLFGLRSFILFYILFDYVNTLDKSSLLY